MTPRKADSPDLLFVRWAGFVDGRIDLNGVDGTYGQLYRTKRQALMFYEDVRRVEIRLAQPRKRK